MEDLLQGLKWQAYHKTLESAELYHMPPWHGAYV
jgi:hypothetical protein